MIRIVRTVRELRELTKGWRSQGERIALTPTMGALHDGHVSLATMGRSVADRVIATIFVNPTQFAAHEDLSRYPRPFEADVAKLEAADVDALFAPTVEEMYPTGDATRIEVKGPALVSLDDAFRPTHFSGVATVVTKLLLQALPDVAIFGEKDWQQLCVIRQFVRDLMIPVSILGAPTVRAADGLALSSRNVYLSEEERRIAPTLQATLQAMARSIRSGTAPAAAAQAAIASLTATGFVVDYVEARDADTLEQPLPGARPQSLRLLAAAKLGTTRLIDNIGID